MAQSIRLSSQVTQNSQLGIDYIPPLNARAEVLVTPRPIAQTNELLVSSGWRDWQRLPKAFSWANVSDIREIKGWKHLKKSPILDPPSQYSCGSCWAFAVVGCLSDRFAILGADKKNPNLSVTYLLSCMLPADKCGGGFPSDGGKFLETHGTVAWSRLGYEWCSLDAACVHNADANLDALVPRCPSALTSKRYRAVPGSTQVLADPRSIQLDILLHGPVVCVARIFGDFLVGNGWKETHGIYMHVPDAVLYGNSETFQCFGEKKPPNQCFMGNHAMVIVGWGTEHKVPNPLDHGATHFDEVKYWVVRNSWGPKWNGNGYCKIAFSNPDTGVNMLVALDRPIRIGTDLFGGVTTVMPRVASSSFSARSPFFYIGAVALISVVAVVILYVYRKRKINRRM